MAPWFRRLSASTVLVGSLLVSAAGLLSACNSAPSLGQAGMSASAAPSASQTSAPEWLQRKASSFIRNSNAPETSAPVVDSVAWIKTTGGQYERAIGGHGDPDSLRPVYVVVAYGRFTWNMSHPVAVGYTPPPLTGHVFVLTFDAATRELGNVDLLYTEAGVKVSVFGEMSPMSLTTD